ncbi:phage integrase central domain-containing protein [Comamonas sp.]|uniref:tyrosine-type recombinase/integrase n=1 Tax=Comamonas sp. TaxID=34028 RepID=UPI00339063DA
MWAGCGHDLQFGMPKRSKELSAAAVAKLREPGRYSVGGVQGLQLRITDAGTRLWIYRTMVDGKRRDLGLGHYEDVTLSQARDEANEKRRAIRLGLEHWIPAVGAKAEKALPVSSSAHVFKDVAEAFIETKRSGWRNVKHAAQWSSSLETYAFPVIGDLDVADIELKHVLSVLMPMWESKTETAVRLRGRIESVLAYAAVHEWRSKVNPAQWKGMLDKILPEPAKVKKVSHHKAMPVKELPAFMTYLQDQQGAPSQALQLLVLTATRSGEVRSAKWSEFDLDEGIWTIPPERMKAGVEHRVPLSKQALHLLSNVPRISGCEYLFPSVRGGKPISDMGMIMLLRRRGLDYVPHGFRSTFRDWGGDETDYPRDLLEVALAHTLESKVEAAYRRSDTLERRRPLMQDWANLFC